MHKHNLILMIIVSLVLSFSINIQFTPKEVYAQSEDNIDEQIKAERVQTLLQRARIHVDRERMNHAETTLNFLLSKVDPENFEAQLLLSDVYLQRIPYFNQETKDALRDNIKKFIEKFSEIKKDNLKFNLLASKFYRSVLNLSEAIKYAQRVIDVDKSNFEALMVLGDANLYSGKDEEARKYYEILIKLKPDNADVLITMLDIYTDESDLKQMIDLTEKVYIHTKIPASVKINYCIDTAIEAFPEDYKIAQKFMQYVIELQPGINYRLMKSAMKYDAAKTYLDEKLQFVEAARVDISAENSLREIKDISDKIVPEVNVLKAILFFHVDEFENAYEFIKKSQMFDTEEYPEFNEYQAYIAEKNDDLTLAMSSFKTLAEREPDVELFKTKLSMLEHIKNALENFEGDKTKRTSELFTAYRLYFNNLLDSSKTEADKLVGFTKAVEYDQDNSWIYSEKGFIELNRVFNYKEAHQSYLKAYKGLNDNVSVMLNLAISSMLDETIQDYTQADEVLQKLNQKYPDNFTYKKYAEILNSIKTGTIKVKAYALYYKAAYSENFAVRLETCEEAYLAQENLFEPLLLWGKINVDSANRIMQSLRRFDPESEEYKTNKLKVDELLKIGKESIKQAIMNARNEEQRYEAILELSGLQSNMSEYDEALLTLAPVLNSVKPSSDALLLAVNLNLNQGNNVRAHLHASKLIDLYPQHPFVRYEQNQVYYGVDKSQYLGDELPETQQNIQPKFEEGKSYRYHINLDLEGWGGENSEMSFEFRVSVKVVEIPTPGFYKLEFEVLCIRGTDLFDEIFDKTYEIEMSDILGICSFEPKSDTDRIDIRKLSRFLGLVMPYVTEMFAYSPSNKLMKIGESWVKRTQGGMLHFGDSNEASFIAQSDSQTAKIIRLIKSGNEFAGNLADFRSELTYSKTQNLAIEMTFDYWNLIPDAQDETKRERMEARTKGSIKLTMIK